MARQSSGPTALLRRLLAPARPFVERVRLARKIRHLRPLLNELRAGPMPADISIDLLTQLHAVWNNGSWSADPGFLHDVATRLRVAPGDVLDCGSGLSTLVSAVVVERYGGTVYSLEQDDGWARTMTRVVRGLGLRNVKLWHAPLRPYGDYVWYDLSASALPASFSLVVCDGPAVMRHAWSQEQYAHWRAGVVLALKDRGISLDHVILDDAEDARFDGVIERWRSEGLVPEFVRTATGRHAVLRRNRDTG